MAQPKSSNCGFTFHVSYRIISETNGEVVTVHNATVHVPYKGTLDASPKDHVGNVAANTADAVEGESGKYYITAWQPNVKYTYTFKITRGSTGTTNPDTPIDPTDPKVDSHTALYPIVFDFATIDDYTTNYSTYEVSNGTAY